jgi:hypothetical protein
MEPVLFGSLALFLVASLLVACDEEQPVPEPAETLTVSGRVLDMIATTPVAGATVQLIATDVDITDASYVRTCACAGDLCSYRTTSDGEGWWMLEDVPIRYNPETHLPYDLLIKVVDGGNPPAYNVFTLSIGDQADLMRMGGLFFFLFAMEALEEGANLNQLSVMMGATIGFTNMEYPPTSDTLAGVTASAEAGNPPESIPIRYLSEMGLPDLDLTETSPIGAFYFVVPDAREGVMPAINVTGTSDERVVVGGYYPACPGGFGVAGLIDPYYIP